MTTSGSDHALVLGFDTSASHCAGALLCSGNILASTSEDMGRGQAERLFPMLTELLTRAGARWPDLKAIGVGVGPGNFTGIRISVAAARGLALSLNVPAYGIDSFAAIELGQTSPCLPTVPAPRGQVYMRAPGETPRLVASVVAEQYGLPVCSPPPLQTLSENIARLAAQGVGITPPAPLYVRPADAAPSKTPPPIILRSDPGA